MGADPDVIEPERRPEAVVHGVDGGAIDAAPRDIGLVGDHHQEEPGVVQPPARLGDAGQQAGLGRRCGYPVDHVGDDEDPVTIEERRPHPRRPALASESIDSSDARSAAPVSSRQVHPRDRIFPVDSRTTGTSPFQPRFPLP